MTDEDIQKDANVDNMINNQVTEPVEEVEDIKEDEPSADNEMHEEDKNTNWGGKREGAGRKFKSKNKKTLQREEVQKEFIKRVLRNANRLFNSQMVLAQGQSLLFRKDKIKNEKGTTIREETIQITDPEEIKDYLDGNVEDRDSYYYITTKAPDSRSIEALLDRAFGKARQEIGIDGDISVSNYDKLTDEELEKRIREFIGDPGKEEGEEVLKLG